MKWAGRALPTKRELQELGVPHLLFLDKIDVSTMNRAALALLQPVSRTPLLLRQIPIRSNGVAIGFNDLAFERAYVCCEHAPPEVVDIPKGAPAPEKEARRRRRDGIFYPSKLAVTPRWRMDRWVFLSSMSRRC